MTDTQRRSLREDIAEVLNDDNGYSHAVQTWAAIARDLLGNLDAAEARIQAVRKLHQPCNHDAPCRGDCAECGQRMPCDTIRALDGE